MRLLYVANIRPGTITERRVRSLQRLGYQVDEFNLRPYVERLGNPISRRLAYRLDWGPVVRQINLDVSARAQRGGYDAALVAKGVLLDRNTVERLRTNAHLGVCIHYSADPTLVFHRTRFFVDSVPEYSLCVTTKSYDLPLYDELSPRDVMLVPQGYDLDLALPVQVRRSNFDYDVVFIGHAERHYISALRSVSEVTKSIAIWGHWEKAVRRERSLAPFWQGSPVYGLEYARRLQAGRLGLGLLSRLAPDQSTTRTFEIPAAGSFLLAQRTEEHQRLFRDGQEAAFFSTTQELQERVAYYLRHADERETIAEAGQRRCLAQYSTDKIMLTILNRAGVRAEPEEDDA